MPDPLPREVLVERRLQRALIELGTLRSMNKKLLRSGGLNAEGTAKEILEILDTERNHVPCLHPVQYKKIKPIGVNPISKDHVEAAALIWSDWHVSEVVKLEDSNGINAYSSTIAANRVWELVQRQKKIITLHRSLYPIKFIWLSILGDMINGSIHEELRLTNDLTDPASVVLAARLLQFALIELKTLGLPIVIDCVVGNHPRMTAKMPTKAQAMTSFDWIVYEMVRDAFRDDKQIAIRVHTGQIGTVEVLGWRYVLEHGIDWKNGHEEEFEDKIRALFDDPIYRAATGLKGTAFDQILIGNLHKCAVLERTIKNGALTGQNELGMNWRLKPIRAQQVMWGISKGHVKTWSYAVDVTDIKDDSGSNPFVTYAKGYMERYGR